MTKSKRKLEKSPGRPTEVDDALGRLTAAHGAHDATAAANTGPVPVHEDDTGHRFVVYAAKGGLRAELRYDGGTFWASQGQMAEMFGVKPHTISEHITRIFSDGELADTEAAHRKLLGWCRVSGNTILPDRRLPLPLAPSAAAVQFNPI